MTDVQAGAAGPHQSSALRWGRAVLAGAAGAGATVASAVVLGDYPLTGAVPWVTPVLIPLIIGVAMTSIDGDRARWWWTAAGPLGALAVLWGVRIATSWGIDPWPASWWFVAAAALLWPPLWGLARDRSRPAGAGPA